MATGGSSQPSETTGDSTPSETLDCPNCFKKFIVPRILPCLHVVCQECLDRHFQQQTKGTYGCPICNMQIVPHDTKVPKHQLASSFPLHNYIYSLIESQTNPKKDGNYCQPCQAEDKVVAEFWCTTCKERLCGPCNKYHTRLRELKHHKTVPINEMEHYVKSNVTFEQNCPHHPGQKLETFCIPHRALCCSVCFPTLHRDCGDIREINTAAEDQAKRCNSRDIIKQIRKIKNDMDKILADKGSYRSQIKTEKEQLIHTMDVRIDQAIKNLNTLRDSFKTETENLYQETNNSIVKIEKQIKSFQVSIANSEQIMESLEQKTSSRQKFIALETLLSQLTSHYEQLKSTTQDDVETHVTLKANAALHDIEGLRSLGAVQTQSIQPESFKNGMKTVNDVMKKMCTMSKLGTGLGVAQIAKPMTSRLTFVKDVKQQKYGRRTGLTGGTVLPDGRLLMADFYNRRLVQFDEDYNMVQEYKVDGVPIDVAAGQTDNEIYIAVRQYDDSGKYVVGSDRVYKCRLDTGLTVVHRIKTQLDAWGIAVSGDQVIVGAEDDLIICYEDGTTVKCISMSRDGYVAVSLTQRAIYHTDGEDVVCETLEGRELSRYRHPQLVYPTGICTDTHGFTYICGLDSHNVHQVSPDGTTSTILELHTISRPRCCVFLPQRNQLVVTSVSEDTALEVYQLE